MWMEQNENNVRREIEHLYRQHHTEMCQLAHSILHDEEDAKDVVNDIFVWLVDHFAETNTNRWRNYLLTSVHNRCQDIIKHRQAQQKAKPYLFAEAVMELPDEEPVKPALVDVIHYAEKQMSPKTKKVFLMRYGDNMTCRAISKELGISIPAVYKHIVQARRKITARFLGVLFALTVMAIAVALSIRWYHQRQIFPTVTSSVGDFQKEMDAPSAPSIVVFENESLSQIIDRMAAYYDVDADIQDTEIACLRLYFQWNQSESLEQVVKRLNHFRRFHILMGEKGKIVVERRE